MAVRTLTRTEAPSRELVQLRGEVASTRRLVRLLMGQSRRTVQALSQLDEHLVGLQGRLNSTAEEAQDGSTDTDTHPQD